MEIYLIRHTTPCVEKGICYGQSDIPLAETFPAERDALLKYLPLQLDAVYTSPLSRCLDLAKCINEGKSMVQDSRLLEMNFGDWEMKKWEELEKGPLSLWMKDFVNVRVPNGENFLELNKRVQDFIHELIKKDHSKVAVITHAGVIRCFVTFILGLQLTQAFKIQISYASITKVHLQKDDDLNSIEYLNRSLI